MNVRTYLKVLLITLLIVSVIALGFIAYYFWVNSVWGAYAFKTGDVCEIITRKNGEPKQDWLTFAKTAGARSHIKRFLRNKGIQL